MQILFSRIALNDIFAMSKLGHNLPISVNDRVITPFHKGFIFIKLCIRKVSMQSFAKIQSSRKFRIYSTIKVDDS